MNSEGEIKMFIKKIIFLGALLALAGCATTGIGSAQWYDGRIQELQTAYQNKELSAADYFNLKNQIEVIRYYDSNVIDYWPYRTWYY